MRIQHNIAALNSYRQLSGNNSAVAKNLEKLSSGYRINRAGDDAAGLAISEKMRAQIKGLETAQKNANDGISLVQTAEGALTEVHSMLNRMVELATQSANGTYDDTVDRANLQKELDSLLSEVDRISEATNFNGLNLLDGSLGGAKVSTTVGTADSAAAATAKQTTAQISSASMNSTKTTFTIDLSAAEITSTAGTGQKANVNIAGFDFEIDVAANGTMDGKAIADAINTLDADAKKITIGGEEFSITNAANGVLTFTSTNAVDKQTEVNGLAQKGVTITTTAGTVGDGEASTATLDFDERSGLDLLGSTVKIGGSVYEFVADAADAKTGTAVVITKNSTSDAIAKALKNAAADPAFNATLEGTTKVKFEAVANDGKEIEVTTSNAGLSLQVGDTDDDFQKVRVAVGDMSTAGLGLNGLKSAGILDQITAGESIDKIKTAINTVSSTRGDLGAIQNRLEHTINNLGVTTENMTAAESRIRDTDMAQEMMSYTKNNILVQAAQAMLAQANQVPQGVLQLLQ